MVYHKTLPRHLSLFIRGVDALQVITLATMGQYLYGGGSQHLSAKHWLPIRDLMGGYQNVGLSLMIIAGIGFLGILSLAVIDTDTIYTIFMWTFAILATLWCWTMGAFHGYASTTIDGAGSTGLWTLGMAGCFFITTRIWTAATADLLEDM